MAFYVHSVVGGVEQDFSPEGLTAAIDHAQQIVDGHIADGLKVHRVQWILTNSEGQIAGLIEVGST